MIGDLDLFRYPSLIKPVFAEFVQLDPLSELENKKGLLQALSQQIEKD